MIAVGFRLQSLDGPTKYLRGTKRSIQSSKVVRLREVQKAGLGLSIVT